MKFVNYINNDEPAYDVYHACNDIVCQPTGGEITNIDLISPEAKLVFLLCCFDSGIFNGGFECFYSTDVGDYSVEILEGLKKINAKKSASILEQSFRLFPGAQPPRDIEQRLKVLEQCEESGIYEVDLLDLDGEFLEDEDNLIELLNQFVRSHEDAIIKAA